MLKGIVKTIGKLHKVKRKPWAYDRWPLPPPPLHSPLQLIKH